MLWKPFTSLSSSFMLPRKLGYTTHKHHICIYIQYTNKKLAYISSWQILTLKLLLVFNMGALVLVLITHFFSRGRSRIHVIGWSCVVTSAAVFAAPLSIMVRYGYYCLINSFNLICLVLIIN